MRRRCRLPLQTTRKQWHPSAYGTRRRSVLLRPSPPNNPSRSGRPRGDAASVPAVARSWTCSVCQCCYSTALPSVSIHLPIGVSFRERFECFDINSTYKGRTGALAVRSFPIGVRSVLLRRARLGRIGKVVDAAINHLKSQARRRWRGMRVLHPNNSNLYRRSAHDGRPRMPGMRQLPPSAYCSKNTAGGASAEPQPKR